MPKLRYAIAALFFAASVGCLALWWRSFNMSDCLVVPYEQSKVIGIAVDCGQCSVGRAEGFFASVFQKVTLLTSPQDPWTIERARQKVELDGYFLIRSREVSFPLWYPALVFALAGVAVLRFRRQFSIRSALIGLAVVAALLGMVVAL